MFFGRRDIVFNESEIIYTPIVIDFSLKCYTGVTFGVVRKSAENSVTVRVYRTFSFGFLLKKNNFAESVTFYSLINCFN